MCPVSLQGSKGTVSWDLDPLYFLLKTLYVCILLMNG